MSSKTQRAAARARVIVAVRKQYTWMTEGDAKAFIAGFVGTYEEALGLSPLEGESR